MGAVGARARGGRRTTPSPGSPRSASRCGRGRPCPRGRQETAFLGDGIGVVVTGPLPQPPLQDEPLGEGAFVTFSATAPNAPGVVTELMLQKMAGAHRKPTLKGYRTREFVAFAAGALSVAVPCEPGAYAGALRFVRWDTGQETGIVPLGRVVVGG